MTGMAGDFGVLDDSKDRAARIQSDHRIADCARSYLAALKANEKASVDDWETALCRVDGALHDLFVACGVEDEIQ